MTDDRPRPEYGEYATPEQQAAAMGRGAPHLGAASASSASSSSPSSSATPPTHTVEAPSPDLPPPAIARPSGYANRFFTIFLLGLGALTLFENIPALLAYASTIRGLVAAEGLSITVPASLSAAGIPTLIANIVIYAATVLLSAWMLRRGRISFYIPLLGWLVFCLSSAIMIAIFAPGFLSQFKG